MKVRQPVEKREWHPSLLAGQIVFVSSLDSRGRLNYAPKGWVMMVAVAELIVAFGRNVTHATCANVIATNEFVLNAASEPFASRAWALWGHSGRASLRLGNHAVPGERRASAFD
ncbi:MAG TPA: flavin reductase [Acidimicrobiales bacterium]|nr:flavin reductase [Acidimicrobiales bacterium]